VFEGLDKSGKSTQCLKLHNRIQSTLGSNVSVHLRFPARETGVGKMIDSYLKNQSQLSDQAIHLLFAANRWEAVDSIRQALNSGKHVICDRYSYSGVAFSTAKGLSYDWCSAPEKGLIEPDAVIFMNLSPAEAQKRYARLPISMSLSCLCVLYVHVLYALCCGR
jgi:dTMP kinase